MIWLPLAFLSSFGFGQAWKWAQRRGCHAPTVVAVNYLVLTALLAAFFTWRGAWPLPERAVPLGVLIGCFFVVSMLVMTRALVRANVGQVLTAFRLSILMPIILGVAWWGERLNLAQMAGIVLAAAGLTLMSSSASGALGTQRTRGGKGWWVLVPVFFCQGLSQTGMRAVHYQDLDGQLLAVLFVIGLTAGTLAALVVAVMRHRPRAKDLAVGAGIGAYNLLCLAVILTALSKMAGTLYYPIHGCAVVILDNLCSHFYWKERLAPAAMAGAGVSALAMLLVAQGG